MRNMRFIVGLGIASFLIILMIFLPTKAQESTQNFVLQGQGIDRCLSFSQSCGEPAANYFCQQRGYSHAISHQTRSVPTTRLMATGERCTVGVNSNNCDEFTNIVCAQSTQNFVLQGLGIDRCLSFSQSCGEPAANYFCQQQGSSHAISHQTRSVTTTRLMGTGQICTVGVNSNNCDEFTNIVCAQGKPKDQESTQNFVLQGLGIDRCLSFSQSCGEPAANYFCQQQGSSHAISHQTRSVTTTRLMGTGQICTVGVNSNNCDEFTNIVCAPWQTSQ